MYRSHTVGRVLSLFLAIAFLTACAGKATESTPESGFSPILSTPIPQIVRSIQVDAESCFIAYMQFMENSANIYGLDCSVDPFETFQLTSGAKIAYGPKWSPNLRYISFLQFDQTNETTSIYIIDNSHDADYRPITQGNVVMDSDYSWSPDSRYLVFSGPQSEGVKSDVYTIDVETREIVNLTQDPSTADLAPTWSPRGDLIAFVSDRADASKHSDDIWIMAPDASGLQNVSNTEIWEESAPAWAPDGSVIVFYRGGVYHGEEARGPSGLWFIDPYSGEERLLLSMDSLIGGFEMPAWSPNGRYIAFQYSIPGNADMYVIDLERGDLTNISQIQGNDFAVSWSPDSQYLLFSHATEDGLSFRVYISGPAGGARPLLLELGNGYAHWAPSAPITE